MRRGRKPLPPAERKARRIAATRRAASKWYHANKHRVRDRKAEKQFRNRSGRTKIEQDAKLQRIRTLDLKAPRYRWMDAHGQIHEELWESPEQLLERLRKEGQL